MAGMQATITYTVTLSEDEFNLIVARLNKPSKLKTETEESQALGQRLLKDRAVSLAERMQSAEKTGKTGESGVVKNFRSPKHGYINP